MKYIYSISQISKLSLTLCTFSITSSVAGLFLTTGAACGNAVIAQKNSLPYILLQMVRAKYCAPYPK